MKEYLLKKTIIFINNNNPEFDNDKLDEIKYGLESIYILITKTIIIFGISIVLNIFFEMLIVLFFYNLLRIFGFGIHASKSYICLISSLLLFLIFPYISKIIVLDFNIKVTLCLVCVSVFFLYAPADTHKRPILKANKRKMYKIKTTIISLILTFICLYTSNEFLANAIISGMIIEGIVILPITYKVFKMPYNNYKTYKYND